MVVVEQSVKEGTEVWSTCEKNRCQTCFLLALNPAFVTLSWDGGRGLVWLRDIRRATAVTEHPSQAEEPQGAWDSCGQMDTTCHCCPSGVCTGTGAG